MSENYEQIIQALGDENDGLKIENSSLRGKLECVSADLRTTKRQVARLIDANIRLAREARERCATNAVDKS